MSTRCSIAYDDDFHLYQECFENENVYLQLDKSDWDASLSTDRLDWQKGGNGHEILLRVNVKLWRKIVEGWTKSQWGSDPTRDHKPINLDISFLESLEKKKPQNNKENEDGSQ